MVEDSQLLSLHCSRQHRVPHSVPWGKRHKERRSWRDLSHLKGCGWCPRHRPCPYKAGALAAWKLNKRGECLHKVFWNLRPQNITHKTSFTNIWHSLQKSATVIKDILMITERCCCTHSFAVISSISVTTVDLVNFPNWPTMDRPR